MMYRVFIFILLTVVPLSGFTQSNLTLSRINAAIIEFQTKGIEDKNSGSVITEWVIDSINKLGSFQLKERVSLDKVVTELKLTTTGLINEETAAKIGQFYGVKAIILGNFMKFGSTYSVTARAIDVLTASILGTGSISSKSMDEIPSLIDDLCKQLEGSKKTAVRSSGINYSQANPYFNLFIPGVAQYQAGDNVFGTVFLCSWIASIGLLSASEICFSYAYNSYEQSSTASSAQEKFNVSELWRNVSIIGAAVYGGTLVFSTIHAFLQTKETVGFHTVDIPVQVALTERDFRIQFSGRF